eukprot:CAMPEP_0171097444 /NCGR_PEP_ID=MMETSP0766_2-20121228/47550_1 /TAXON_ID=439317 /ORGANISM="Gambierdiscus australes, Strain CAWD 149" /LENGTH=70 /DNA_ID=CAMNT_0011556641 /DNA_START=185 /DNA_END=397 /DNA_ORIENTATION=+
MSRPPGSWSLSREPRTSRMALVAGSRVPRPDPAQSVPTLPAELLSLAQSPQLPCRAVLSGAPALWASAEY